MRIISGKHRGRTIRVPKGLPVRPTTDRTKESLFNILPQYVDFDEMEALDLFCGTGGITMECLSRGASRMVAVDKARSCIRALEKNLELLGESQKARLIQSDISRFLGGVPQGFDFVFMDPPYAMQGQETIISTILSGGWLKAEGVLVVEHISGKSFEGLAGYDFSRKYGDSSLSFFMNEE